MIHFRKHLAFVTLLLGVACNTSCKDYWFGEGNSTRTRVVTPEGPQSGLVTFDYILEGEEESTSVDVGYSTNSTTFRTATQAGGDNISDVPVSSDGTRHTFIWDSGADLGSARNSDVTLRVSAQEGDSDRSDAFTVRNAQFLVGVAPEAVGALDVFWLNTIDASVERLNRVATGGGVPTDVIFHEDLFFVAHETSNLVGVFALNDESRVVAPLTQSQAFGAGGEGAKTLAAEEEFIFALNRDTEILNVFQLATTGAISLHSSSGQSAAGWQDIAAGSGRLFAAQTDDSIRIFDVGGPEAIVENESSPFDLASLAEPRSLVVASGRLYVASAVTARISGFAISEDGALSALPGSPYSISTTEIVELSVDGDQIFGVTADEATLLAFDVAGDGQLSEQVNSPFALEDGATDVVGSGSTVVTTQPQGERFDFRSRDADGTVAGSTPSRFDTAAEIERIAVSR